jgi:SNF2 family DNA or RNA helicase
MPESSLDYRQTIGRIDRIGQEQVPMYYYLVMDGTLDSAIYDMIEKKVEYSEEILNKLVIKGEE